MVRLVGIPKELREWQATIRERAVSYGLDFYEVAFEMVEPNEVNEIAALGGFPTRYPHWRFGMEYDRLSKSYAYGLSKIYEMVINTDPCYAYLLSSNSLAEQKLVMAHVYGHADFFKHNAYFAHTNRKMIDEMANHAVRVRQHQDRLGADPVEEFIDACLSVDNLVDIHAAGIRREARPDAPATEPFAPVTNARVKNYMDKFVTAESEAAKKAQAAIPVPPKKNPEQPVRDVLGFILENAPLESWEQDCLSIVRDEAAYFAPQGQTKIMNEGWASYWHSKMMTQHLLSDAEVVDYADVHSGTMATPPGGFNPYKIGIELFRDIEERWNKGQFGKEWDEVDDYRARDTWDKKLGLGREKIFSVRKLYNDVTFIDTFLTEDFCQRLKLFTFAHNRRTDEDEVESRDFGAVKAKLLQQLTNFGQPLIEVVDANYLNRGELYLQHRHDGRDLKPDYADKTLRNLSRLWKRPVNLETTFEGKGCRWSFDGENLTKTEL